MLTTTLKTLGAAKTSVLRRVTTTSFLHSGFLISNCTMRPPTFPVAPSTTTEYCIRPRLHSVMIAHWRIIVSFGETAPLAWRFEPVDVNFQKLNFGIECARRQT